ncbi:hypothetical protein PO488_25250, partial [Escherichia coli]
EKRVFLVILFTSFSGSLVSRIPGAVQTDDAVFFFFSQFAHNSPLFCNKRVFSGGLITQSFLLCLTFCTVVQL